jgi:hypothetical protein
MRKNAAIFEAIGVPLGMRQLGSLIAIIALNLSVITGPAAAQSGETNKEQQIKSQLWSADAAFQAGNYTASMLLVRPLAENGVAEAQHKLGILYLQGRGVQQDPAQAREWLLKAAAQRYPEALHSLGVIYGHGEGVDPDLVESLKWFILARETWEKDPDSPSRKASLLRVDNAFKKLGQKLTPEQQSVAWEDARQWGGLHGIFELGQNGQELRSFSEFQFMSAGEVAKYCQPYLSLLDEQKPIDTRADELAASSCFYVFGQFVSKYCEAQGQRDLMPVRPFVAQWVKFIMNDKAASAAPFLASLATATADSAICLRTETPSRRKKPK